MFIAFLCTCSYPSSISGYRKCGVGCTRTLHSYSICKGMFSKQKEHWKWMSGTAAVAASPACDRKALNMIECLQVQKAFQCTCTMGLSAQLLNSLDCLVCIYFTQKSINCLVHVCTCTSHKSLSKSSRLDFCTFAQKVKAACSVHTCTSDEQAAHVCPCLHVWH